MYVSLMSLGRTLFIHHPVGPDYTCGCIYNHENYDDIFLFKHVQSYAVQQQLLLISNKLIFVFSFTERRSSAVYTVIPSLFEYTWIKVVRIES